ncbi:Vacuolar Protein Sorting-Associated Protein 13D [Manis pentadactyla]|nr:Vacuolar Protein Sorting-Associated Protein 13D [Manis pentadactyla]
MECEESGAPVNRGPQRDTLCSVFGFETILRWSSIRQGKCECVITWPGPAAKHAGTSEHEAFGTGTADGTRVERWPLVERGAPVGQMDIRNSAYVYFLQKHISLRKLLAPPC